MTTLFDRNSDWQDERGDIGCQGAPIFTREGVSVIDMQVLQVVDISGNDGQRIISTISCVISLGDGEERERARAHSNGYLWALM